MKKYNLYLDDERMPRDSFYYTTNPMYNLLDWVIVRSYDEFVEYITTNGLPQLISFDHDLADVHYDDAPDYNTMEKTGYHCAKWLVEYCIDNKLDLPQYAVHSMNGVGAANIKAYFKSFEKAKKEGLI